MAPTRVLQVVYSMNRGGVEVWLSHVLAAIDKTRFQVDFLKFSQGTGEFENHVLSTGSRIWSCPPPSRPFSHARAIRAVLDGAGPYDVVHSHDATWNGTVLSLAQAAGVPIRIAHSHSNLAESLPPGRGRRMLTRWSVWKSRRKASHGLACSSIAAASYFGTNWRDDPRWQVFYCGQDFSPFHTPVDAQALRHSLGIPSDAYVVGHVGSFRNAEKNQSFLVDVARHAVALDEKIYFLLVGDGVLRPDVMRQAAAAGLEGRVLCPGSRADVPRLMLGAMDMFVFPSRAEGLGLALVEAQAAGLPCLCSDVIPDEADVVPGMVQRLSLTRPASEWSQAIVARRMPVSVPSRRECLRLVEQGRFNLTNSIDELEALYSGHPIDGGVPGRTR